MFKKLKSVVNRLIGDVSSRVRVKELERENQKLLERIEVLEDNITSLTWMLNDALDENYSLSGEVDNLRELINACKKQ